MSRTTAVLAVCLLTFISAACDKVPLLAPTNSTITMAASEATLELNGTMQVTAIVTEGGGTAPQNGTVVTFTTSMGAVDPIEARTTNGRANTTFHAGSRSGTATVRAFSGAAGTGDGTAELSVRIGGAAEGVVVTLRTDGTTNGGTTTFIVARVVDGVGNPLSGMSVTFTVDHGVVAPGSATTDGNGEARATVTTSEQTVVNAQVAGTTGTITIGAPGSLAIVVTTPAPPAAAEVGQPVTFTVTPTTAFFSDVIVDFGDGTQPLNIGALSAARTIQHTYTQRGNFVVTARAANGSSSSQTNVTVTDRAPLGVTLAASPNPVPLVTGQGLVLFTATLTPPTGVNTAPIARVEWSFGDNTPGASGTGLTINHKYNGTGSFIATVRIVTTDGREGSSATTVRVTP